MRRPFILALGLGAGGALAALAGCPTTAATTTLIPGTGIVVHADTLIGNQGCGQGPTQVFKYAAVVIDPTGRPVAAQVYDCFADATFVNLVEPPDVSLSFSVLVYLYDMTAYVAGELPIANAVNTINNAVDAAAPPPPDLFRSIPATWTTTCTAAQTFNVFQYAVCDPLEVGDASPGGVPPGDASPQEAAAGDAMVPSEAAIDAD